MDGIHIGYRLFSFHKTTIFDHEIHRINGIDKDKQQVAF